MSDGPRSLWEQYASEVELWRRGRLILVLIALLHFLLQALVILALLLAGNVERFTLFAAITVVFWLQFYFVWAGVHWVRWLWGVWDMVTGFCLIIWAWRDTSTGETVLGTAAFLTGFYLCFSPSIYLFAKRQKESAWWGEWILLAGVCCLLLCSIAAMATGLFFLRHEAEEDAVKFADEVNERVYVDRDENWTAAHVTPSSYKQAGPERLRYFFKDTRALGRVEQISSAHAAVQVRPEIPRSWHWEALVASQAQSEAGPVQLSAILRDDGQGWRIDRLWWRYLPMDGNPPDMVNRPPHG